MRGDVEGLEAWLGKALPRICAMDRPKTSGRLTMYQTKINSAKAAAINR